MGGQERFRQRVSLPVKIEGTFLDVVRRARGKSTKNLHQFVVDVNTRVFFWKHAPYTRVTQPTSSAQTGQRAPETAHRTPPRTNSLRDVRPDPYLKGSCDALHHVAR